ncbi:hypothetical protein [Synechococcus sp. CS-1328]|uniref:hypothetical protein n=1 Tax=Synechococcus sp. CS-1328 TaxID=2847976 RepID=UPI00223B78E0|nr:hypothetical protein [Synechococcus sp. CS-1328]MCT0225930.1 hypothetical protein [Synechococcus sp. CS-1328]
MGLPIALKTLPLAMSVQAAFFWVFTFIAFLACLSVHARARSQYRLFDINLGLIMSQSVSFNATDDIGDQIADFVFSNGDPCNGANRRACVAGSVALSFSISTPLNEVAGQAVGLSLPGSCHGPANSGPGLRAFTAISGLIRALPLPSSAALEFPLGAAIHYRRKRMKAL